MIDTLSQTGQPKNHGKGMTKECHCGGPMRFVADKRDLVDGGAWRCANCDGIMTSGYDDTMREKPDGASVQRDRRSAATRYNNSNDA